MQTEFKKISKNDIALLMENLESLIKWCEGKVRIIENGIEMCNDEDEYVDTILIPKDEYLAEIENSKIKLEAYESELKSR